MNQLDDLFRDGLRGRAGEVPADMWSRISAGKAAVVPEGDGIDQLFAGKLADRTSEVPKDMWARIAATGVAAAAGEAALDQQFAAKLKDREADVPAGMWDRVWRGVSAPAPAFAYRRYLVAGVALLLLLGGLAWWQLGGDATATSPTISDFPIAATISPIETAPAAVAPEATPRVAAIASGSAGAAAGAGNRTMEPGDLGARNPQPTTRNPQPERSDLATRNSQPATDTPQPERSDLATRNSQPTTDTPQPERSDLSIRNSQPATLLQPQAISLLPTSPVAFDVKRQYRPKAQEGGSFRAAPRHRLQTELLFGAAYANQRFSVADEANRPLVSAREISEYAEVSYQVTLRTNYRLGEHLLLTGGLTYAEIRNQFDYPLIINGVATDLRINNSIRQLEAPLLLGYRLPGRRLHVSLNAGPVINLTTSARGIFLHPDFAEPQDLASSGNYRRHTGIGFMASLSTTYKIGNKEPFLLVVEPFFKSYPGSFTVKDAPLREKYWVAGLQLGVRKEF